ncbi:MAG: NADH-quinone oxidoreductase subunit B family protein [Acidimicrobiales bacterium]
MPWIPRGLVDGIVTTRYPRRPDGYGPGFRGTVVVDITGATRPELDIAADACPTGAISVVADRAKLDRGRCILCGRCIELVPEIFHFDPSFETSSGRRDQLVVPNFGNDLQGLEAARAELARRVKALRRSIHIRHLDAGSDGSDEWEVAALTNPVYDVQRLGIYFTASPRHADLLLVTGVGSAGMINPLRHTLEVMPHPKVVIAVGVDAISGGLLGEGYAARGGITGAVPVDVLVPGSPPTPFGILYGILLAVGILTAAPDGRAAAERGAVGGSALVEDRLQEGHR